MARTTVFTDANGGYLYIDYNFTANAGNRTWSFSSSLNIQVPPGPGYTWTYGPWNASCYNGGLLRKDGMPAYSTGSHELATYSTSGNYNANGDAPSINLTWAFNVNAAYGYSCKSGSISVTGSSIGPDGTPPTGLTAALVAAGSDWADIAVSIDSYGTPSGSANRYIEAAVLGSSTYGNPYKYVTSTAVTSATLHVDNAGGGNLTIVPNTQYHVGGYATNRTRSASVVGSTFTTLPAAPVVTATDQGHGVIDFVVTHANEGSALTVTDEYSIDGGTTWTAISGGAFTLTLATQTEVIVKRSSTAGESTAAITVVPQFVVGIYASVADKTKKIDKIYAPVNGNTKKVTKIYASVNGKTKLVYEDPS